MVKNMTTGALSTASTTSTGAAANGQSYNAVLSGDAHYVAFISKATNLVAGDTQGHIGHHVRAKVPRRAAANGWLPVPGWLDRHAWKGWIDWERMPRQIDPAAGLIVTANNRVVERHDDYLCTDCHPPHRAQRIWQLLVAMESADVAGMEAVHRDTLSLPAREICARLAPLTLADAPSRALRDRLVAWDARLEADSQEADAYVSLRMALARAVARR
eukprot:gene2275-2673_t